MDGTIRWGIVGGGELAQKSVVPALALLPDSELVAVTSRRPESARAFAAKNGIRAHDTLEALLADPEVDAVYIATPNGMHAANAIAAAGAGKHVLCDKPMALDAAECESMIAACSQAGVRLGVVFQNRFHPAHVEARRHLQAGALGEIQYATAQLCTGKARGFWQGWRADPAVAGSGAIVGQAVHPIDILRHLMGSEVVRVQAMTDQRTPDRPVDEMCHALLHFANGAFAHVTAGTVVPRPANDVVVYGSEAKIVCTNTLGPFASAGAPQGFRLEGSGPPVVQDHSANSAPRRFADMFSEFNACIREGRDPAFSGRNGLTMVTIANAVLESSRSGRAIDLG